MNPYLDHQNINSSSLYENQQMGNFNMLIGYYLGVKKCRKPFSINIYQQTPLDKTIGDMFGGIGGKYFIMEFKRTEKDYDIELKKPHRIKLLDAIKQDDNLKNTSLKGHLICHGFVASETIKNKSNENEKRDYLEFNIKPYLNIENQEFFWFNIFGVEQFTNNLAFGKTSYDIPLIGMNYKEFEKYLEVLKNCSGESKYETSGVVCCFSAKSGMTSIEFKSLQELDLKLNLNLYVNYSQKILEQKEKRRGLGM